MSPHARRTQENLTPVSKAHIARTPSRTPVTLPDCQSRLTRLIFQLEGYTQKKVLLLQGFLILQERNWL